MIFDEARFKRAAHNVRKDPRSKYCFLTGGEVKGRGDPHHVVPRSARPDLVYEERNIVIVNRGPHDVITSGDMASIRKLPGIYRLLARMKEVDLDYYKRFKTKLNETNTNQAAGL